MRIGCDAIAFIEKTSMDVGFASIGKSMVSPGRAPAVTENEASITGLPHHADGMATTHGRWLKGVEIAMGGAGVIPGGIDAKHRHDGSMGR